MGAGKPRSKEVGWRSANIPAGRGHAEVEGGDLGYR